MSYPKIDFSKLSEEQKTYPLKEPTSDHRITIKTSARPKRKITKYVVIFLIAVMVISAARSMFGSDENNTQKSLGVWTQIKHLVLSGEKELKGEEDDRINFLLLGIGGEGHDGPYLTDTIILVSFKPKEKKVALISIPRDLVMPIPGYGWRKINNANAYGEINNPGKGAELTVETISKVFNLPIQYYVRVDFNGFEKFIDELDGVKICVDQAFTDNLYPTEDYKTQTVSFQEGCQMMDSKTALQYVRSRHGNNGEGSDFARSRRQQKVLLAAKEKLLSFSTLVNPFRISNLYSQYSDNVATNMEIWEMVRLASLIKNINKDNVTNKGLVEGPGGQLETVIGEDGAFLLQPPGGNYDEIRGIVANIFNDGSTLQKTEEVKKEPIKEEPKQTVEGSKVEIRNGTFISGLAGKVEKYIESSGYNVVEIGNAPFRDYEKNVIYDLSDGKYPKTIEFLTQKMQANLSQTIPSWVKNIAKGDIILILGQTAGSMDIPE
ncbi:MAG: LCP family protein [Patescibacteria group bacterium]|jgi:anionic cell wall polymer biosynthesis LytR-Cps2A-Psr (LCP) family protein